MDSSPIPDTYVFVDTETTGTNSYRDRLIEISLIKVRDNQIIDTFTTLINPEADFVPPEISTLTGIDLLELKNAPTFAEIKNDIKDFLKGCLFVAHNARFDYGFIRREYKRLDETFETKTLCTVKLSRRLFPSERRHSLDNLIIRHQLSCPHRHRAYDDAHVLYQFFLSLQHDFPSNELIAAINDLTGASALPLESPLYEDIKNLPSSPGVYVFLNHDSTPLYIGKSVDIKSRVYSHFYQNINNNTDQRLTIETSDIKVYSTPGEMSALMLESQLIKDLRPLHNRHLRRQNLLALLQTTTKEGYFSVKQIPIDELNIHELHEVVGVFSDKNRLKKTLRELAAEFSLCEKLLGIQSTSSACFAYHLGRCHGACINKELYLQYNLRFLQAFSTYRIRSWPFPGPIALIETDHDNDREVVFVIDQWCLLTQIDNQAELNSLDLSCLEYHFDFDLYKILKKFLLKKKKQNLKIIPLKP